MKNRCYYPGPGLKEGRVGYLKAFIALFTRIEDPCLGVLNVLISVQKAKFTYENADFIEERLSNFVNPPTPCPYMFNKCSMYQYTRMNRSLMVPIFIFKNPVYLKSPYEFRFSKVYSQTKLEPLLNRMS